MGPRSTDHVSSGRGNRDAALPFAMRTAPFPPSGDATSRFDLRGDRPGHRSPVWLAACVLAVVTAVALLAAGIAVTTRPAIAPATDRGAANVALVRRFYDAVNETLRSGDATSLDAVVAADLVEHPSALGGVAGREGLVRSLVSRRAAFPGLRLAVDDVRPAGPDRVVAFVHPSPAAAGRFLGLPVPPEFATWGPTDVFRLEADRVVERWGNASGQADLEPF
jgi:predicted ester cyclase